MSNCSFDIWCRFDLSSVLECRLFICIVKFISLKIRSRWSRDKLKFFFVLLNRRKTWIRIICMFCLTCNGHSVFIKWLDQSLSSLLFYLLNRGESTVFALWMRKCLSSLFDEFLLLRKSDRSIDISSWLDILICKFLHYHSRFERGNLNWEIVIAFS